MGRSLKSSEILLSSPCGFFGEPALWPLCDLHFAAISSGDAVGSAATPRSHFTGIRIFQDGASWRCEALVSLSPVLRPFAIPFAELTGHSHLDSETSGQVSFVLEPEKDVHSFEDLELSANTTQCAEEFARLQMNVREDANRIARALATQFLPRAVHDLPLPLSEDSELPCDSSYQLMADWVSKNRERLLTLQFRQVDDLLRDAASRFALSLSSSESHDDRGNLRGLDDRIELLLMGMSDFIRFLSRILKLHWYLGHDDWEVVLDELDGKFPITPPPSLSWIWNHRPDAPWWQPLSKSRFPDLAEENDGFQRLDLIALARGFLWPGVYQAAKERSKGLDSAVLYYLFPSDYHSIAAGFQVYLAKFADWWTYQSTKIALTPIVITSKMFDRLKHDNDISNLFELLHDLGNSNDAPRSVLEKNMSLYKKEVLQPQDWELRYHEAFPKAGEGLTIDELLKKERLGFTLKKLESEGEGDIAWTRFVHNAVFEDAYGPHALARKMKTYVRQKLFTMLGSAALTHSYKEKSDHCQMLLREFVRRFLRSRHGDDWSSIGIPGKITEKVSGRNKSASSDIEREPDKLFDELDIIDYVTILKAESNWTAVVPFLERVGIEMPSKRKLDDCLSLSSWTNNRNAAAHPEKTHKLAGDALELLDGVQRTLRIWLLLTNT